MPIAQDEAMLFIEVVLKPGFLNVLGRKAVSKDFDVISIAEAKIKLKELFDYSIESLYDKYKKR